MKTTITALKLFFCLTVITGVIYPLAVWGYAQAFFKYKADGGIILRDGKNIGMNLVGQNFTKPEYFWPRPSAVAYNPMPSGGSNYSLTSKQLWAAVQERKDSFGGKTVPADMLFASGSGLDPHISSESARMQCARVAQARKVLEVDIISLMDAMTEPRQFGILGEPRVNVLRLNLALDEKYSK